ncbi:MAG: DUF3775 domain-containing protein [Rhodomicrobium sp.]
MEQVRFIALLANTARAQRDSFLGRVENDLAETKPARGEHNPTAELGFEPVPAGSPQITALAEAIGGLTPEARSELFTLMRIGQGDLAVQKLYRGAREAEALGDETVRATLLEDADLHDHLMKGLFEAKLASP